VFEPRTAHSQNRTITRGNHGRLPRKDDARILDSTFALDIPPSENSDLNDDVVTRLQRQVAEMAETLAGMRAGI
jgi:hypothetical protein